MTIGKAISEIRGIYKLADQDANPTDRFLYSLIMTPAFLLLRRQDAKSSLIKFNGVFQTLEFEELIEVDRVQAGCLNAPSGCTFRRTKEKIPFLLQGYYGPLLRSVSSLDLSRTCTPIYPTEWAKMARQPNFKYNPQKFYWFSDGHLVFPNVDWEAISLDVVSEFSLAHRTCDRQPDCLPRQESELAIPDFLFTEIKQQIRQDLGLTLQIPSDPGQDNKHPLS